VSAAQHAFVLDTAVEAVADHRFAAAVTDRWNALGGRPNGGICLPELPPPDAST
jgi:hypothetical protein